MEVGQERGNAMPEDVKVLDDSGAELTLEGKPRKWHSRYPWEDWMSRKGGFTLKREEYGGRTDTFIIQLRYRIRALGKRALIVLGADESITVTWK